MKFRIISPTRAGVRTGNRCTAESWTQILRELGHEVLPDDGAEVLVALNAELTNSAVRDANEKQIVVVLTGTDLYPMLGEAALDSLTRADRIIALQPLAETRVPIELRDRVRVIVQSAPPFPQQLMVKSHDPFDICVVGHLRQVKDPMRAAEAANALPADSKIRIRHAGAILDEEYRDRIRAQGPRYEWLGALPAQEVQQLVAKSQLQVVSSFHEGGARVIGEAVMAGTPLLAARNDASCSLLGDDYPGLFDAGATDQLTRLMVRAETDATFYDSMNTAALAPLFDPEREREAWRKLIDELASELGAEGRVA